MHLSTATASLSSKASQFGLQWSFEFNSEATNVRGLRSGGTVESSNPSNAVDFIARTRHSSRCCILAPAGHAQSKPVSTKAHAKPAAAESLPAPMKAIGTKSAPITMEVFSDYQCPACRAFFENTLRYMINDYVASGKVYLVHRDFPLPMHPYSMDAARWANAAARIGRFETVDAALFDNQDKWTKDGSMEQYISAALGPTDFKRVQKLVAGCLTQTPGNTAQRSNRPLLRARHVHPARSSPGETGAGQFHSDHSHHLQRPALPAHVRHLHLAHHEAVSRFADEPVARGARRTMSV